MRRWAPPFGPIFRRKLLSSGEENALVQGATAAPMRPGPAPEFMMEV